MDALSNSLTGLCLECSSSRSKIKSAKVKKTIEKSVVVLPIGCGAQCDTKGRAANHSARPDAEPATCSSSSTSKSHAAFSVRRASLKMPRVVVCTWGARCGRPTCTYFHASPAANYVLPDRALAPKPCRFGVLCQRASCVFRHPSPLFQP